MESEEEDQKSRSQVKREFRELKELVKELVDLPDDHLRRMPLSPRNLEEIVTARDLSRAALQRQLRYLVRRIEKSDDDIEAIRSALDGPLDHTGVSGPTDAPDDVSGDAPVDAPVDAMGEPSQDVGAAEPEPHELWAAELIAGDDQLLGAFVEQHPDVEHRKLRRLVRNARKEQQRAKGKPGAAPKLVAFLHRLHAGEASESP